MDIIGQIQEVEDRLMNAQLASDVDTLDILLADDLVAVGPDGQLVNKADDLAAHRTGVFRIERIDRSALLIKPLQPNVVATFVGMTIQGYVQDQLASGHYRYTRVWTLQDGNWQVSAAHISQVSA